MICSNIRMILAAGQQKGAIDILTRYRERTRFLMGCSSCRLYCDALEPKAIMLEEVWNDESALNRHLASASYQEVLLVMEMASAVPEVRFIHASECFGFERIEQARAALPA
jgi:quinol monooxygenase YgiN